jgi:hypothetical protein
VAVINDVFERTKCDLTAWFVALIWAEQYFLYQCIIYFCIYEVLSFILVVSIRGQHVLTPYIAWFNWPYTFGLYLSV